tara:strand:+ start:200 stop:673 length:474 start_codon:yes stop_codon:yes gene_type:complete
MSIMGKAIKGFGMLKKAKNLPKPKFKSSSVKSKKEFDAQKEVFGEASRKNKMDQTIKRVHRIGDKMNIRKKHPAKHGTLNKMMKKNEEATKHPKAKVIGKISTDKKKTNMLKKANKLEGVHGGKGMVALGAGAAGTALLGRHFIHKHPEVKKLKKKK